MTKRRSFKTAACWILVSLLVDITTAVDPETCANSDGSCVDDSSQEQQNENSNCKDQKPECPQWAAAGECEKNPPFMWAGCQRSCNTCDKTVDQLGALLKKYKESVLQTAIRETPYGIKQFNTNVPAGKQLYEKMKQYMDTVVFVDPAYAKIRDKCKLREAACITWASMGECDSNPKYMLKHCAPVCQTCNYLNFDSRCPVNASVPTVLTDSGDLDQLFVRLTTEYEATIHVMPAPTSSSIPAGPWVVTLDHFLTPTECHRLIELGADLGYTISKDIGLQQFDGSYGLHANDRRTSTNAWCTGDCYQDPLTQSVLQKIARITSIAESNSEYLQLLRYDEGQFYKTHHDYIPHQAHDRQQGARILTVFLYLNDVEQGGGTNFPLLPNNLTIFPQEGRALIWPSVLNEDPNVKDGRTVHQALPVERGIKYGANAWLHQRDYKEAVARDCN